MAADETIHIWFAFVYRLSFIVCFENSRKSKGKAVLSGALA